MQAIRAAPWRQAPHALRLGQAGPEQRQHHQQQHRCPAVLRPGCRRAHTSGLHTRRCQPDGAGFAASAAQQQQHTPGAEAAAAPPPDWAALSAGTLLQQQLPAGSNLQPLLQPLLSPSASPGGSPAGSEGGAPPSLPGEDVAPIAAASTSLAVNMPSRPPSPEAIAAVAAAVAPAAAPPPPIDVEAREVPRSWRRTPGAAASEQPEQEQQEQGQEQQEQAQQEQAQAQHQNWVRVVGVCAFAAMLCYLDRTNISTAIVPMAEQFGWSKQFCSVVMSAFFAGYGATQVWGGQLSDRFGGAAVLAAGLAGWSLATALTPWAASAGTWQLLGMRAVLGMAQGIAFPAIHALLAKKVPSRVHSGAIGAIMALAHCGTALGFGASPAIIDSLGWGWTFYLFGGGALLWLPMWLQMARQGSAAGAAARTAAAAVLTVQRQQAQRSAAAVASVAAAAAARQASNNIVSTGGLAGLVRPGGLAAAGGGFAEARSMHDAAAAPQHHPLLEALEQQQQQQAAAAAAAAPARAPAAAAAAAAKPDVGFWPLMRRKEVWAIAVAQYAAGWGFYGLLAWLPQFFIEHCGLQLSQLGGFTLAPYLLQAIVGASAGLLADNLIVKRRWGVRDVRVLMQVAGMLGPAACLFAAASPLSSHSPYVATGLITLGMGMSALTCSGVSASHLDIAPRHAGMVFGVGNTAGTLAGLVAVPGLGYVLQHTGNWSIAFGLAAAHNVVGAALWAKWVGDRPLPEDGGPVEGADEAQPQRGTQQQPQLAGQPVLLLPATEEGAGADLKLKVA